MRSLILTLAAAGLLAACAPTQPVPLDRTIVGRCDAEGSKSLIGSHVGAVSFPQGANVRIVCTTCPTTKDLRPDRMNVRFDEVTGIIRSVDCG